MARFQFLNSLHFKIASGVIATIVLISSIYFVVDYRSNQNRLLGELQESADQLASISLQGLLELAMIGQHSELLQQAIERLGANSSVERIFLLDLSSQVRFSSDPADIGLRFSLEQEGCRDCHALPLSQRRKSGFLELGGRRILRNVTLVPNGKDCHSCHDPAKRSNGVLVIDFPTAGIWKRLRADLYETLGRAGLTVLLTLTVLGILMNKLVIIRLRKLMRATAWLGGASQSTGLAALGGSDEIGRLAHSFDEMTRRVDSSIQNLRSQQANLQNLMNSLPDGLVVIDRDQRVEMTNSAADQVWSSRQLSEMLTAQTLFPEVSRASRETFRTGALTTCEIKLNPPGSDAEGTAPQEPRIVEICCSPVRNAAEEIVKAILLVRDVTQRKLFETQASRAERLASVGRLAAGFAHEINNPMAAITTCVEGLSRYVKASAGIDPSEKNEINDYLSTVGEAALRCKEITQRLLSASAERGSSQLEPVDLAEIVQETLILVDHQARHLGVEITSLSAVDADPVMGDRRKLSQLLLNLLLNSLEAVDEGGRIQLSVLSREGSVELEISDNGCGIPEQDLEHIFDPFFTTKTEGRGTGLGLSIAQWIVRQHHGRMHVQSRAGEGTSFSILLPASEEGTK